MEIKKCLRCSCDVHTDIKYQKYCDVCSKDVRKENAKQKREENTKRNKTRDYSLDVGGKICPKCKIHKEYSEYNKCYKENDGYKSRCRECQKESSPHEKEQRSERSKTKERREVINTNRKIRRQNPEYREKENKKRSKG